HGSADRRKRRFPETSVPVAREARARRRVVSMGRDAAAGGADDPERHQSAPLCNAEGNHGREKKGDPQSRAAFAPLGSCAAQAADRQSVRAGESEEDADHRRVGGGSGEGARTAPARRGEGLVVILVIAEQRKGTLNRATWETVAAAQQLSGLTNMPVCVLVAGVNVGPVAKELAAAQVQ